MRRVPSILPVLAVCLLVVAATADQSEDNYTTSNGILYLYDNHILPPYSINCNRYNVYINGIKVLPHMHPQESVPNFYHVKSDSHAFNRIALFNALNAAKEKYIHDGLDAMAIARNCSVFLRRHVDMVDSVFIIDPQLLRIYYCGDDGYTDYSLMKSQQQSDSERDRRAEKAALMYYKALSSSRLVVISSYGNYYVPPSNPEYSIALAEIADLVSKRGVITDKEDLRALPRAIAKQFLQPLELRRKE